MPGGEKPRDRTDSFSGRGRESRALLREMGREKPEDTEAEDYPALGRGATRGRSRGGGGRQAGGRGEVPRGRSGGGRGGDGDDSGEYVPLQVRLMYDKDGDAVGAVSGSNTEPMGARGRAGLYSGSNAEPMGARGRARLYSPERHRGLPLVRGRAYSRGLLNSSPPVSPRRLLTRNHSYSSRSPIRPSSSRDLGFSSWAAAGLRAPSPPLPCSIMGRRARTVDHAEIRRGLPPGVVVFPSGNMLMTASVNARSRELPNHGDLRYVQFRSDVVPSSIEVNSRVHYTEEQGRQLAADFRILRMTFPVR